MEGPQQGKYICVHCGLPVNELFKQYSPTVLKLTNCSHCQNVADKYIEYDTVIILIDLILINKQAFRHILFNTTYEKHWKVALLLMIVKSFDEWSYLKNLLQQVDIDYGPEHFLEETFYYSCLVTVLGKLIFFGIISTALAIFCKTVNDKTLQSANLLTVWKGLICSSFGYFLILPSLIWVDFHREINLLFVAAYTLLSQIQVLSVVCWISKPTLATILIIASSADYLISNYIRWWLWFS